MGEKVGRVVCVNISSLCPSLFTQIQNVSNWDTLEKFRKHLV